MIGNTLHQISNRIRGLTLDVCVGAFLSAEMARHASTSEQSIKLSILIVCVVFVIYVIDHLVDYKKSLKSTYSYKFSWIRETQQRIVVASGIVMLVAVWLLLKIYSHQLLIFGLTLGCMVIIYYLLAILYRKKRIKWYPKEWLIAIVFTSGIWGYYLLQQFSLRNILFAGGFFMSMLLNTYLFSYFEQAEDKNENHFNMVNYIGEEKINRHVTGIIITGIIINASAIYFDFAVGTTLFCMNFYLAGIYLKRRRIKKGAYGLITDAVLLFPVFYVLL